MSIKYINPFIEATIYVFSKLFYIQPKVLTPYLLTKGEAHEWDISGIIGIAGEAKGMVVISFREFFTTILTSRLLNREVKAITDEVVDAVGEIINIIAGNAKKGLEEYKLLISLPSIVQGKNHQIRWPSGNAPIICVPFETSHGVFNLSITLECIITGL